jgi:hypothetical protein
MKRRTFLMAASAPLAVNLPLLALAQTKPAARAAPARTSLPAMGRIELALEDSSKAFVNFYEQVVAAPTITEEQRWAFWKAAYDINPLGTEEAKLREQLNAAWPRYAQAMERIKAGYDGLKPSPADMVGKIGGALRMEQPLKLKFVAFVGQFDGRLGVKTDTTGGELAFALEDYDDKMAASCAQTLTQMVMARMEIDPQNNARNVAESVVYRGVRAYAARTALASVPIATDPAPHKDALRTIKAQLNAPKLTDEAAADAVGQLVVGRWINRGLSLHEIARTPKENMLRVTGGMIDNLLKG